MEGATHVDALLINSSNGSAVFIEAKVLSDISYCVQYDSIRNQIIRNLDVMLNHNNSSDANLKTWDSDKTLFLLLTPKLFKDNPRARLYVYIFSDYKSNPELIGQDLIHRGLDFSACKSISERMGWITWEDLRNINQDCCKWLDFNSI